MLAESNYTQEHILRVRENRKIDPALLERTIYAFGLLEALVRVGLPFVFKGGTCLMLLLDRPRRLSTDIDIIVKPGISVDEYIEAAAQIFPFRGREEQIRKGKNGIVKRHFKFVYDSPLTGQPFYILLDVLFEENPYSRLLQKHISNELLAIVEPYFSVNVPSVNCILGDKLTAFAPHTTGIPFGIGKELEIIKQLYDVASLTEVMDSFQDVHDSYFTAVQSELRYRGLSIAPEEVLLDTIHSAICVACRGTVNAEEYAHYMSGIRKLANFTFYEKFSGELAIAAACRVMYVAACVLTNTEFSMFGDLSVYAAEKIADARYKIFGSLRKLDLKSYAYAVETFKILGKNDSDKKLNQ